MAKKHAEKELIESSNVPVPTGFTHYAVTPNTVLLSWNKPDGVDTVHVERSTDGETWKPAQESTMNGCTDNGREPGMKYHYRAYAVKGDDRSAYTDVDTAVTAEA